MPVSYAICVSCGNRKNRYDERCGSCGFRPQSTSELGKSLMLASDFEFDDPDLPKSTQELENIANQIRAGQSYHFPPEELEKLEAFLTRYERAFRWLKPIPMQLLAIAALLGLGVFVVWFFVYAVSAIVRQ